MTRPAVLQMCPASPFLESALAERFEPVRWFDLSPAARGAWLDGKADSVRAVVTAGHVGCDNALIDRLPNLGIVAINGVGYDKVDLDHARARGIAVSITSGTLSDDVADLAVGLIIGLLRQIPQADAFVRRGDWTGGQMPLTTRVTGRRFGVVGLGHIGMAIARRLEAFGPVAYTGRTEKSCSYAFHADIGSLARAVDILIVASAATAQTRHLVDAGVLAALGPAGYLVNIARGSVVDEAALITALEAGTLAGAALDVFEDEPRVPEALRQSGRVLLTPHIASATHETRRRMAEIVLENLDAFLTGAKPPHALV